MYNLGKKLKLETDAQNGEREFGGDINKLEEYEALVFQFPWKYQIAWFLPLNWVRDIL